jgi:hypothetical protein
MLRYFQLRLVFMMTINKLLTVAGMRCVLFLDS